LLLKRSGLQNYRSS